MYRVQLASSRQQYNILDTNVIEITTQSSSTGFSSNGTIYLSLQAQNKIGFNYVSGLKQINYLAGQEIVITVKSNAVTNGEDIEELIISGSLDNNPINAFRLCSINLNQETLPKPIIFDSDELISLNEVIGSVVDLPISPIHGMGRGLVTTGYFYVFNQYSLAAIDDVNVLNAVSGRWLRIGTLNTYVNTITEIPGSYTALEDVEENDYLVDIPEYQLDRSSGLSTGFWLVNTSDAVIPLGTPIGISVYVNGNEASQLFHNKLKLIFKGYVNTVTGALDILNDENEQMLYIDTISDYVYGRNPVLVLQKDLGTNEAFYFRCYPELSVEELRNKVPSGATLSIIPFIYEQSGEYLESGKIIGDIIYSDSDKRRIVPDLGLSVKALKGSGVVDSFQFPIQQEFIVSGLAANTSGQSILINGNGAVYKQIEPIEANEAIRAIVSTTAGISKLSSWSNPITLSSNDQALLVNIPHPLDISGNGIIREDYPDVIADMTSYFNPIFLNIYIERTIGVSTFYYQIQDISVLSDITQEVTINTLSTPIALLDIPNNTDNSFGLYETKTPTLSTLSGGTLATGTYRVRFGYKYTGTQVTGITHNPALGCIPELAISLVEVIQNLFYWGSRVSLSQLKAIPKSLVVHGQERKLEKENNVLVDVIYDAYSDAVPDDLLIFLPDFHLGDSSKLGRWLVKEAQFSVQDVVDELLPLLLALT